MRLTPEIIETFSDYLIANFTEELRRNDVKYIVLTLLEGYDEKALKKFPFMNDLSFECCFWKEVFNIDLFEFDFIKDFYTSMFITIRWTGINGEFHLSKNTLDAANGRNIDIALQKDEKVVLDNSVTDLRYISFSRSNHSSESTIVLPEHLEYLSLSSFEKDYYGLYRFILEFKPKMINGKLCVPFRVPISEVSQFKEMLKIK